MNCPECGSQNVVEGVIRSYYGVTFVQKGTENKFRPKAFPVRSKACLDCGKMFDFRIMQKKSKKKDAEE